MIGLTNLINEISAQECMTLLLELVIKGLDGLCSSYYPLLKMFVFMAFCKPNALHHLYHLVKMKKLLLLMHSQSCFEGLLMIPHARITDMKPSVHCQDKLGMLVLAEEGEGVGHRLRQGLYGEVNSLLLVVSHIKVTLTKFEQSLELSAVSIMGEQLFEITLTDFDLFIPVIVNHSSSTPDRITEELNKIKY